MRARRGAGRIVPGVVALALSAGCGAVAPASAPAAPTPLVILVTPAPTATASPALSPGAISLPECSTSDPCTGLAPGTYVLKGEGAFMAGLTVTVPVPWTNGEQDIGEFIIRPGSPPGDLKFQRDITPVLRDGTPAHGVLRTSAGLIDWIRTSDDFVTSDLESTTIGKGIAATTLLVGVSKTAKNADPGCPVQVCVPLHTAEGWPPGEFYAIGRQPDPLYVRMYFADVLTGSVPHTLVVVLDAGDAVHLPAFEAFADPVLDSLQLPPGTTPAR